MIKDGFLYLAALIFAAPVLVNLPKIFKGKKAQVFFNFCTADCTYIPGAYAALHNESVGP